MLKRLLIMGTLVVSAVVLIPTSIHSKRKQARGVAVVPAVQQPGAPAAVLAVWSAKENMLRRIAVHNLSDESITNLTVGWVVGPPSGDASSRQPSAVPVSVEIPARSSGYVFVPDREDLRMCGPGGLTRRALSEPLDVTAGLLRVTTASGRVWSADRIRMSADAKELAEVRLALSGLRSQLPRRRLEWLPIGIQQVLAGCYDCGNEAINYECVPDGEFDCGNISCQGDPGCPDDQCRYICSD